MGDPEQTDSYDDGLVRLDAEGIHVARYHLPFGRPRHVAWAAVRGYQVRPMTTWTGRYRLWGTTRLGWWFALDLHRARKDRMVVLDVPGTKPVLTPDDVDAVCAVLDRHLALRSER